VIQDDNGIAGILIPSSLENEPCVMFRLPTAFPQPRVGALGLYKGCTLFDDMRAVRFGYGWRNDAGAHFVQDKYGQWNSTESLPITFDEETGCYIIRQNWECFCVVDFLPRP
jgi:hypothetical protein